MEEISLYWAGRLFNQAEQIFNRLCAKLLSQRGYKVILPQDTAEMFKFPDGSYDLDALAEDCLKNAMTADVVIVNLDGSDVDSGTSLEAGLAIAAKRLGGKPKLVIGVRTDFRGQSEDKETGVNAMFRLLDHIVVYNEPEDYSGTCALIDHAIKTHLKVD